MAESRHFNTFRTGLVLSSMCVALFGCGQDLKDAELLPNESTAGNRSSDDGSTNIAPTTPVAIVDPAVPATDVEPSVATRQPAAVAEKNNSSPALDKKFTTLPDGRLLSSIKVSGAALSLSVGTGEAFTEAKRQAYLKLKAETQTDPNHAVQWVFMDLDAHQVLGKSLSSSRKLFGASSSKPYVGATLLSRLGGKISNAQLQLMADMLVISSNTAWTALQSEIGDGSSDKGRQRIQDFTQAMGYKNTRAFQGSLGSVHGNELIPDEAIEFIYDIYTDKFPGAALEWKIMHACRTGAARGRKYMPSDLYIAGKTGTYDGPTVNPATGKQYTVKVRNQLLSFSYKGRQYGLVVLANTGSDESAALLAGGLLREL